jgi:hypothetical protein
MMNITGQTNWNDFGPCRCDAAAGKPCKSVTVRAGQILELHVPHTGRPLADAPEPGPVWTNGMAPAARPENTVELRMRREPCPVWCTRHEHGMQTSEPHRIELLSVAVLDGDLTTDVPLTLDIVQDLEPDSAPAVHLSIGHTMYQPTSVSLSRSDRARLAAMLLVANELTQR